MAVRPEATASMASSRRARPDFTARRSRPIRCRVRPVPTASRVCRIRSCARPAPTTPTWARPPRRRAVCRAGMGTTPPRRAPPSAPPARSTATPRSKTPSRWRSACATLGTRWWAGCARSAAMRPTLPRAPRIPVRRVPPTATPPGWVRLLLPNASVVLGTRPTPKEDATTVPLIPTVWVEGLLRRAPLSSILSRAP